MPESNGTILFIGEHATIIGGIERYMAQTAGWLAGEGFTVDALFWRPTPADPLFQQNFRRIWTWPALLAERPRFALVVVHKVREADKLRALRQLYPDLRLFVHDHEYYCPRRAYYYPLLRRNCQRAYQPLVCALCGSLRRHPDWRETLFGYPALWRELRQVRHFLVISAFMRGRLLHNGIAAAAVTQLPPVIAAAELRPPPPAGELPRLLFLGQLVRGKGVDLLLQALALTRQACTLDILGSGQDEARLRRLAEPLGQRVRFIGWSATPEQHIRQASAVVLPWRWQEPFGLVGPEALACGVPLAGFAVGGIGEYLLPEQTGVLAPAGDAAALAAGIDRLLADPAWAETLGRNGQLLVREKFSQARASVVWRALAGK